MGSKSDRMARDSTVGKSGFKAAMLDSEVWGFVDRSFSEQRVGHCGMLDTASGWKSSWAANDLSLCEKSVLEVALASEFMKLESMAVAAPVIGCEAADPA